MDSLFLKTRHNYPCMFAEVDPESRRRCCEILVAAFEEGIKSINTNQQDKVETRMKQIGCRELIHSLPHNDRRE